MIEFSAPIEEAMGGGAVVGIPEAVVEESGGGGRIPIRATFDGISYQGSIVSMGGRHVLGVLKAIRTELGKVPGEQILVAVERDDTERTVTIPAELESLLVENPSARATLRQAQLFPSA